MPSTRPARHTRRPRPSRAAELDAQHEQHFEELRRLLVGPEQARIATIESTGGIDSGALPEVVGQATEARGPELAIALEPSVTKIVRTFARDEAALFGEILAPTIGAAVRKAVADAFAVMLERFNEALERSLSWQSIRWRMEAKRTGRPFAEVVLLHTLVFRVEEVFLIHPGTGLVLEHVAAPMVGANEPDQVAAMLEAIDAFMRDAFRAQPRDAHLSQIRFGDRVVWVDRSPSLAIAAVVRGQAPQAFGDLLRETRERIFLTHQTDLAHFTSNTAPFAGARPALEQCLRVERTRPPSRARGWLVAAGLIAAVALGALVAALIRHERMLDAYAAVLEPAPGIVVASVTSEDGDVHVFGLRDPLAAAPDTLVARAGLPPADLDFESIYSLDPPIVLERARRVLRPPAEAPNDVTLSMADGVLRASGTAPRAWIERTHSLAPTVAGVDRYEDTELRSSEDLASWREAARALAALDVRFAVDSSQPRSTAQLREAVQAALRVIEAERAARGTSCIVITGYADPQGPRGYNVALSAERAQQVRAALESAGVPADHLVAVGGGVRGTSGAEASRTVSFDVRTSTAPGAPCAGGAPTTTTATHREAP